jgi:hypothetical protein
MTLVEVLVASGITATLATSLATVALTGGRMLELSARQWNQTAGIGAILTTWPQATALEPPAAGWSAGTVSTVSAQNGGNIISVTWTRPDGLPLTLVVPDRSS